MACFRYTHWIGLDVVRISTVQTYLFFMTLVMVSMYHLHDICLFMIASEACDIHLFDRANDL